MDRPPVLECPVWSVPPVSLPSTTIRILRLIEMTLDDDDFDLQLAHSGEEAIQLAESVELDAILLDIMMPGMTGIEVLEELRRNSNVPVILVSARMPTPTKSEVLTSARRLHLKAFQRRGTESASPGGPPPEFQPRAANRVVNAGDVLIDLDRRLVTKNNDRVSLTRTEWLVLQGNSR